MNVFKKILAVVLNAIIPFLGCLSFEIGIKPGRGLIAVFAVFCALTLLVGENNLVLGYYYINNLSTAASVVVMIGFAWSSILVLGEAQQTTFNFKVFAVGSAVAAFGLVLYLQTPVGLQVRANSLAPFIEAGDVVSYGDEASDRVGGLRLVLSQASSPQGNKVGFAIAEAGDVVSLINGSPAICSRQQSSFACRDITSVCEFFNTEPTIYTGDVDIEFELQHNEIIIATWPYVDRVGILENFTMKFDRVFAIERIFRGGESFSWGEAVPVYGCFDT